MKTRLYAVETLVNEYINSPKNNDRLLAATSESAFLVSEFVRLGLPAMGAYCIATPLRVLILQERAKVLKVSEQKNIQALCSTAIEHITRLNSLTLDIANATFSEIKLIYSDIKPGPIQVWATQDYESNRFIYFRDGLKPHSKARAQEELNKLRQMRWQERFQESVLQSNRVKTGLQDVQSRA